jgi:serine/threonine-protein kinase RsbW
MSYGRNEPRLRLASESTGIAQGMEVSVALRLEADPTTIPVARKLLQATLEARGAAEPLVDDLAVALSEACSNAVQHAGTSSYDVSWTVTPQCCEIEVTDRGAGFDLPRERNMPDPCATEGRGLALLDYLVDDVQVEAAPGLGTAVRLRQAFSRSRLAAQGRG